jgi:hypothetical protein
MAGALSSVPTPLIFLCMQFGFVIVVPKYFSFATISKDLLAVFMLWFCPAFGNRIWTYPVIRGEERVVYLCITRGMIEPKHVL